MLTVKDIVGGKYTKENFVFFWGHRDRDGEIGKNCLSQWYVSQMEIDGLYYHCMEQYLMAEKARTFGDNMIADMIMSEHNQMTIKKLGRRVSGYDDEIWDSKRQMVSVYGNFCKFTQNQRLKDFLLSTDDRILVEASPSDIIWGIGLDENHPNAVNPALWRGRNLLGFALMEVRERLRMKMI